MAKLKLDGTSPSPSPYADWTSNYRTSQMIEDRRGKNQALLRSDTPMDQARTDSIRAAETGTRRGGTTGPAKGGGYETVTPDDYQASDIGAKTDKATPGSGFPSVTSEQQSRLNYSPAMEDYVTNSKKK